nr:proline-rich receptor-like protein kinase PERK15 [Ipomoea trifida]
MQLPTREFSPRPSGSSSGGLRTTQETQFGTEIRGGTTLEILTPPSISDSHTGVSESHIGVSESHIGVSDSHPGVSGSPPSALSSLAFALVT